MIPLGPQTHPRVGQDVSLSVCHHIVGIGLKNIGFNK